MKTWITVLFVLIAGQAWACRPDGITKEGRVKAQAVCAEFDNVANVNVHFKTFPKVSPYYRILFYMPLDEVQALEDDDLALRAFLHRALAAVGYANEDHLYLEISTMSRHVRIMVRHERGAAVYHVFVNGESKGVVL